MGVVNEHRVRLSRCGDDLDAPLDTFRRCKRLRRIGKRYAELPDNADGNQRIADGKAAGDPDARARRFRALADLHGNMIRSELDLPRREVRISRADGIDGTGSVRDHFLCRGVVEIEHTMFAHGKELCLRASVVFHRSVKIQMILRQVGKCADLIADAVHAVQLQSVGGNLHHHMGTARIAHLRKEAL